MKKKIITVLILVIILAAGILATFYNIRSQQIPPNDPDVIGNKPGNLLNGGLFCEANDKVYFANSYDNNNLYVMNLDETEMQKLNDLGVFSINVAGDFIYFLQGASGFTGGEGFGYFRVNPGLYRSRTNGKDLTHMINSNIFTAGLSGNEIYYQNFNNKEKSRFTRLYRIGIDGDKDNIREISDEVVEPSSIANGYIYYSRRETDHFVWTIDLLTNTGSILFEGNTFNAVYDNGYIYYMDLDNNYRLCRYSIYSNTIEVLTTDRVDLFNVGNGVVFYQINSPTAPALMRMDDNGNNKMLVREGNHKNISFTSYSVYFQDFHDDISTYRTSLYGTPYVDVFSAAMNAAFNN